MKNFMLILLIVLAMVSSCGEDCIVGRSNYTFEVTIAGEARKAIIVKPVNECVKSPVLFYFHGRGGTAKNSQAFRRFHDIVSLNNMYIVYTEGTNYDDHPEDKNGWVVRFPHISTDCEGKDKDLEYVEAIIDHLAQDDGADIESMGACGFSNGGFFTLSLAQIRTGTFKGFAAYGCYSSYAPDPDRIVCDSSYRNAINKNEAEIYNAQIVPNPAPTLYIFGDSDSTLHTFVSSVYLPECDRFSYFQNTILQLCIKNNSEMPNCANENFMTNYGRQIYPAKNGGEETQVEIYQGNHSWGPKANDWISDFFVDLLYQG